ncbi:hypothetical protein PR048_013959 [Dryococelus australis]|uniref:Uncharacterized protein n=1 Tax=Dryococelus australis TaxID=614101 RepID=A0ABQ9HTT0_9NEOP|nr:hypothetical protein PR048_013959 [Dryococelus australis]
MEAFVTPKESFEKLYAFVPTVVITSLSNIWKILQPGQQAQNAITCTCCNHALNLSLSKCSKVQNIRNAVGIMKEVIILCQNLGRQLVGLCETRWVERHDIVLQFCTALPKIAAELECVSMWKDSASASKAKSLLCAISESDFTVAVVSLSDLLITTLQLSRTLQKKTLDLKTAGEMLRDRITTLKAKRGNCEQEACSVILL